MYPQPMNVKGWLEEEERQQKQRGMKPGVGQMLGCGGGEEMGSQSVWEEPRPAGPLRAACLGSRRTNSGGFKHLGVWSPVKTEAIPTASKAPCF